MCPTCDESYDVSHERTVLSWRNVHSNGVQEEFIQFFACKKPNMGREHLLGCCLKVKEIGSNYVLTVAADGELGMKEAQVCSVFIIKVVGTKAVEVSLLVQTEPNRLQQNVWRRSVYPFNNCVTNTHKK